MSLALALVFILLALGIVITQAISAPKSVTLTWLRLGDLIALPLLAVAVVVVMRDPGFHDPHGLATLLVTGFLFLGSVIHVMLVQLGKRKPQNAPAICVAGVAACFMVFIPLLHLDHLAFPISVRLAGESAGIQYQLSSLQTRIALIGFSQFLSAFLVGGSILTMLLGHAYLTAASEMTQQPFLRLTRSLFIIIMVRGILAAASAGWPWYHHYAVSASADLQSSNLIWPAMLITARFAVGIIVPAIMVWMAHQCVKIRSNQSATGILYVAGLMLLIGELTAIALWTETALPF